MRFRNGRSGSLRLAGWLLAAVLLPGLAAAAELQPATAEAYQRHIAAIRQRFATEAGGPFWVEQAPADTLKKLRAGEVLVWPGAGDGIVHVNGGLIHDWRAAAFAQGVSLEKVLAAAQDYPDYAKLYSWVVGSGTLGHEYDGGSAETFRVFFRLEETAHFVTGVIDIWTAIEYRYPKHDRAIGISHADCIRQVENAGQHDEYRLPDGVGSGFLWRADTFSAYVARDNGVYLEFETVGLSRTIPRLLGWIVEPIARRLGRGSASDSLKELRDTVLGRRTPASTAGGQIPLPAFWCTDTAGK